MIRITEARKLLALLSAHEKRRGLQVLALMLIMALVDSAGVASIVPFLTVLGNPEIIKTSGPLSALYTRGGFDSVFGFQLVLGCAAFVIVISSAVLRVGALYATNRYIQMRRYSLATRLLQGYLRQPYVFFLNRNTSDLAKSILSEVDGVVGQVLKPAMDLMSYALVACVLVSLLIVVDPLLALASTMTLAAFYGTIYLTIRKRLRAIGLERIVANKERFKAASEAFGGIKDLIVLGREQAYVERFRRPAARLARYQYTQGTLATVPGVAIQAIGFGGILAMAVSLMAAHRDLGQVLPVLGLYAFGGLRLLPAAQHIYASVNALRFGWPAVDAIHADLMLLPRQDAGNQPRHNPLSLKTGIRFDCVSFTYPAAEGSALHCLSIEIEARTSVGIVGQTGAGKTTAVDLILGLLAPTTGQILIDGLPLAEVGIRAWQKSVGYVPQTIYLADASVAQNIAFGVDPRMIDYDAVERCARIASIHQFVIDDLPQGYKTEVGDRGVRLSGGQRQRIGIARALYHDPAVLVLDEATSALDSATERAIMEAVDQLSGEKTVIMIAHRLTTVERCNKIIVLERGRLAGAGSYAELRQSNSVFRRLAVV